MSWFQGLSDGNTWQPAIIGSLGAVDEGVGLGDGFELEDGLGLIPGPGLASGLLFALGIGPREEAPPEHAAANRMTSATAQRAQPFM